MIARALRNAPRACIAAPRRGLGALRARLADLVEDRGETEVLQYGAMKWTVRDAKRYGDGLARGLAEFGVQAGDAGEPTFSGRARAALHRTGGRRVRRRELPGGRGAGRPWRPGRAERGRGPRRRARRLGRAARAAPRGGARVRRLRVADRPGLLLAGGALAQVFCVHGVGHAARLANHQHLLLDARPLELPPLADDAPLARVFGDGATQSWTHREAAEAGALPVLAAVLHLRPTRFDASATGLTERVGILNPRF